MTAIKHRGGEAVSGPLHHRDAVAIVMRRLVDVVDRLHVAGSMEGDHGGASQVVHAVDYALNGPRNRDDDDYLRVTDRQALDLVRALIPFVRAAHERPGCEGCSKCLPLDNGSRELHANPALNGSSCTGDPCTCANGIGCVNIPVDQW